MKRNFEKKEKFWIEDAFIERAARYLHRTDAVGVYIALARRANKEDQWAWQSIREITSWLNISRAQVRRALQRLEQFGIIRTERRAGKTPHYRLIDATCWHLPDSTRTAGGTGIAGDTRLTGGTPPVSPAVRVGVPPAVPEGSTVKGAQEGGTLSPEKSKPPEPGTDDEVLIARAWKWAHLPPNSKEKTWWKLNVFPLGGPEFDEALLLHGGREAILKTSPEYQGCLGAQILKTWRELKANPGPPIIEPPRAVVVARCRKCYHEASPDRFALVRGLRVCPDCGYNEDTPELVEIEIAQCS